jgi:hypothetical protein
MARVTVSYEFADGERIFITAAGKRSYPDAMAELRATAVKGLHDALREIFDVQAPAPKKASE